MLHFGKREKDLFEQNKCFRFVIFTLFRRKNIYLVRYYARGRRRVRFDRLNVHGRFGEPQKYTRRFARDSTTRYYYIVFPRCDE